MPVRQILCIRFSSLGDILLTLPVFPALRGRYPDARITLATKEPYAGFIRGRCAVDEVVTLPRTGGTAALLRLGMVLRRRRFDIVIDLHASLRSRLLAGLAGGRLLRYDAMRAARTALVRKGHAAAPPAAHAVERYFRALQPLGISLPAGVRAAPPLAVAAGETGWAGQLTGSGDDRPLVGISPGGKHGPKQWPAAQVRALCTLLLPRFHPVIIDSDGMIDAAAEPLPAGTVTVRGIQEPGRLLALVARTRVLVSTDSGPLHAAGAMGVPAVALFGPTHPCLGFAPAGPRSIALHSGRACSPCSLHGSAPCRLGIGSCMNEIGADRVLAAVESLLDEGDMHHG